MTGFSEEEVATIAAFRDTAIEMVRWHRERAEGFERKAANLLGLGGLALALVPFAVNDLTGLDGWATSTVRWATAGAAVALGFAVFCCIRALRPRKRAVGAPETEQLQEQWARFRTCREWTAGDVNGMLADSLLARDGDMAQVLATVKAFADAKARWVRIAAYSVACAVTGLTIGVLSALIGAT